uniref:Disease resistance N-terminal domain-containing protein n=1 Tax=Fagus sylvatica TaxID=28930 RepID=A0A2N9HNK1_FAGSY
MMEFAFSVAEKEIEKQWSLTYEEISSDLNKLELTTSTIQAVLQDAEEKQVKSRGLTVWLGQVKDVFYDVADVWDEFKCEALRRQVVETHGSIDSASYTSFNPRDFSHKIKREMTHSFVHDSDVVGKG